jgi:hypothetical protein
MAFGSTFEDTNLFILRIGKDRTLPLRLYLHRIKFTDLMFQVSEDTTLTCSPPQELLSTLRDILPVHLHLDPMTGSFTTRYIAENKPVRHNCNSFQFLYYFTETVPQFSLFVPGKVEVG